MADNVDVNQPEYVSPANTGTDSSKVKRGCLIGCLVLLILGSLLFGGCFIAFEYMKGKMGPHLLNVAKAELQTAIEEDRVPEADLPLYTDLVAIAENEEASFYAIVTVTSLVVYDLEDGTVTDEERADATAVKDAFGADPGMGMMGISAFYGAHPAVQEKSRKLQGSPKIMPKNTPQ